MGSMTTSPVATVIGAIAALLMMAFVSVHIMDAHEWASAGCTDQAIELAFTHGAPSMMDQAVCAMRGAY